MLYMFIQSVAFCPNLLDTSLSLPQLPPLLPFCLLCKLLYMDKSGLAVSLQPPTPPCTLRGTTAPVRASSGSR